MKVITNNVARPVVEGWQLTQAERDEFDYIDWSEVDAGQASPEFVRYKGQLHDLGDFFAFGIEGAPAEFSGFHGSKSDSFFSGLLVRYVDGDNEQVVIARYYS